MAVKFTVTNRAHVELQNLLAPLLAEAAVAIADECDAQSSWGSYAAGDGTFRGRRLGADLPMSYVAALNRFSDARTNRLLRVTAMHTDRLKKAKKAKP